MARSLGKKTTTQVRPVRDSLIKRGLLGAPRHGQLSFTVPMFEQFIRRSLRRALLHARKQTYFRIGHYPKTAHQVGVARAIIGVALSIIVVARTQTTR